MSLTIGVHQPNFFPHHAFFKKMAESDKFILLTHCQFEKGGYQNRFFMDEQWHTMSVTGKLKDTIWDKKYEKPLIDWKKIKSNLRFYNLSRYDKYISGRLRHTNEAIIRDIADQLCIKTHIITDYDTTLKGTERLVDICETHGATTYLSGPSGKKYLDVSLFEKAGIKVAFQEPSESKPILEVL